MPHITKGGKYIFGWTIIRDDGSIFLPEEATKEYRIAENERVIIISGSKATEGIVIAKIEKVNKSGIAHLLSENRKLANFKMPEGELARYKGRRYCWATNNPGGIISLPKKTMEELDIRPKDALLVIRGSNLGFVMGKKGPLIAKARNHPEIPIFR
jgi:bifunctional DNA-binding transcriptional regulator/antitoxin component of YhaV-PrlF toxin-antitoxin module